MDTIALFYVYYKNKALYILSRIMDFFPLIFVYCEQLCKLVYVIKIDLLHSYGDRKTIIL